MGGSKQHAENLEVQMAIVTTLHQVRYNIIVRVHASLKHYKQPYVTVISQHLVLHNVWCIVYRVFKAVIKHNTKTVLPWQMWCKENDSSMVLAVS